MKSRALTPAALVLVAALGCVPARGGWDAGAFAGRHPVLVEYPGQRVADALPHWQPDRDGGALFLCRWSTVAPIPVSLPPDASEEELALLRLALGGWSEAGLGVRFAEARRSAALEIRFAGAARDGWAPAGSGDTVADCAISADFDAAPRADRVAADMSYASIYLRRTGTDAVGRERPLTREELLGAALHELGHALGFAGHVASGGSVMSASPEVARRVGRALLTGEGFTDATLSALYALPSGVVVGRIALVPEQRNRLDRLGEMAAEARWHGPWSRVGDASARVFWRERSGASAALEMADWPARLRAGDVGALVPNTRADALLRSVAAEGPR